MEGQRHSETTVGTQEAGESALQRAGARGRSVEGGTYTNME